MCLAYAKGLSPHFMYGSYRGHCELLWFTSCRKALHLPAVVIGAFVGWDLRLCKICFTLRGIRGLIIGYFKCRLRFGCASLLIHHDFLGNTFFRNKTMIIRVLINSEW